MAGLVSSLYKLARTANNIDALTRPKRLPRRIRNIAIGKAINKSGIEK
jgi:hypothetical protein